jgi:uncharacterized protein YjbI with pentapeptide repeats
VPVFIDADPQAFRFVLDFLRAVKDKVAPPCAPEALASSVLVTARRFRLTDLEEMVKRAAAPARSTHSMPYEMVVQFYMNGKINFKGMDLHGYSFRGWDLRYYTVSSTNTLVWVDGNFQHANLRGCDFSYATLPRGSYFLGADIEGCTFTGTSFNGKVEADWRREAGHR